MQNNKIINRLVIRYLRHKEIDFQKWDSCVQNSINGLPSCYSLYLDLACEENWDGLIADDYSAIFPLPFKNRVLFKQIYQPFFVQQLGMFFTNPDQMQLLNYFIEAIPAQFRKINLQLNTQNQLQSTFLKLKHKLTHHILLNKDYASLVSEYGSNTKRNLKKAIARQPQITNMISPFQMTELRKKYLGEELKGIQNESDFLRLQRIMEKALALNMGEITGVINQENEIDAAVFYLKSNQHIIYLNAISSDTGKEKHAMTFLIDHLLKRFSGSDLIFDFEGSMIPGIARFYKGFGAVEISYPVIVK